MSYSIYDAQGYVGDLASNNGLIQLRDALNRYDVPLLQRLFVTGSADITDDLINEIHSIPHLGDGAIRSTLSNLVNLIQKCDEIVVITQGIFADEPQKNLKKKFGTDAWRETNWKAVVKRAESYEPQTIKSLNTMFSHQKSEAIRLAREAVAAGNRTYKLIDVRQAKRQYIDSMKPHYQEIIMASYRNGIEQISPESQRSFTKADPPKSITDWLTEHLAWAAETISQETALQLQQILLDGFSQGLSIDDIAANITGMTGFSTMRATRIARTEIISTSNQGALSAYTDMGVEKKEWFAAMDERTRETHAAANGQIRAIGDDFDVGAGAGPAPGQIGLPEEDINCRCILLPVVE